MGELKNTLSWSHSRATRFDECLRAYYWTYYGSWGGWDRDAEPRVRRAYLLKQMTTMAMWAGSVVHDIVERAVRDLRWGRTVRIEALQAWAREHMIRDWRQSLRREWEYDPKHRTNLFEHYYEDPTANTRSVRVRDRVNRCLESFRRSRTYEELAEVGRDDWLAIEDLEQVQVGDVPVWVKLDCAYRADDRVVVADWKTGASRPEHRTQLEVYALYAVRTWKDVVPEDLVLRGVYLDDGKEVDAAVSAGDLEELEARVVDSVARMREALEDPEENVAREEAFPMTDERRTCRYCVFRDLCGLGPVTSG